MQNVDKAGRCLDGRTRTDSADAVGALACACGVGMSSSGPGCPICIVLRRFAGGEVAKRTVLLRELMFSKIEVVCHCVVSWKVEQSVDLGVLNQPESKT